MSVHHLKISSFPHTCSSEVCFVWNFSVYYMKINLKLSQILNFSYYFVSRKLKMICSCEKNQQKITYVMHFCIHIVKSEGVKYI